MNLIEQLGGYEAAKEKRDDINHTLKNCEFLGGGDAREGLYERLESIEQALLDYRRQHNIFEVGDKVVYVDDFMPDSVSIVSEVNDRVWLNGNNAVCIKEMIKHAEDEEIKAGKRLEVNQ